MAECFYSASQETSSDFQSPVKVRRLKLKLSRKRTAKINECDVTDVLPNTAGMEHHDNHNDAKSSSVVSDSETISSNTMTVSSLLEPVSQLDNERHCPSCCQKVPRAVYSSHVIFCLRKFSRDAKGDDGSTSESTVADEGIKPSYQHDITCQVCGKHIGHMNGHRRQMHLNRCLDNMESEVDTGMAINSNHPSSSATILPCPFCHIQPKTQASRMPHIKKCAAKAGVSSDRLLDAIKLLERQTRERQEAGLPPMIPALLHKVPERKKMARRRNITSEDNDSEEMNVALAMSLSTNEQDGHQLNSIKANNNLFQKLGCQAGLKTKPLKRKNLRNMKSPETPILLLRSQEDRSAIIGEMILKIVTEQTSVSTCPFDWSQAPPHKSRFKQSIDSKCCLWELASLSGRHTSNPNTFYVESLNSFISPCKVKPGDKIKRLSQIPGYLTQHRRSSTPPTTTISDSIAGPSTQEISYLLQTAESCEDKDEINDIGQSGYFTLGDEIDRTSDVKSDECENENHSNVGGSVCVIEDVSDVSDKEKRLLEEVSMDRHRRAAAVAETFDRRLKDMRDEFCTTPRKMTTVSQKSPQSNRSCKRPLHFLTQAQSLNDGEESVLILYEQCEKDNKDMEPTAVTNNCKEYGNVRSYGSPELFGDSYDDVFNAIDLENTGSKTVILGRDENLNITDNAKKELDYESAANIDNHCSPCLVETIVTSQGISTSTPKNNTLMNVISRKRAFSVSPLDNTSKIIHLSQNEISISTKVRKSVSFMEPTDSFYQYSSNKSQLPSPSPNANAENNAKRQRVEISSTPSAIENTPNISARSDMEKQVLIVSFNDVWDNFQDDGGYYEQPPTTQSFSTNAQSIKGPTSPSYFPGVSSPSDHSQEFLPDVDTLFEKDSSFVIEVCNEKESFYSEIEKREPKKGKKVGKRKGKHTPITPLPHYSLMPTPEIKKELSKIGVKGMPRKKGTKFLKFVYEETHPLVPCDTTNNTTIEKSPSPIKSTPKKKRKAIKNVGLPEHKTKRSKTILQETPEKEPKTKKTIQVESPRTHSQNINNFIKSHLRWHEEILQYKAIDVNALREDLKSAGYKISLKLLKNHLDEQCVTYVDLQNV